MQVVWTNKVGRSVLRALHAGKSVYKIMTAEGNLVSSLQRIFWVSTWTANFTLGNKPLIFKRILAQPCAVNILFVFFSLDLHQQQHKEDLYLQTEEAAGTGSCLFLL